MPRYTGYRIKPTNYYTLSEDERAAKLRGFVRILSSMEGRLDITMVSERVSVDGVEYTEKSVYLASKQDMGGVISQAGFGAVRLDAPYAIRPDDVRARYVRAAGTLYRAYAIYDMSRSITPAWINGVHELCGCLIIRMWPVPPSRARRMLVSHANVSGARAGRLHAEEAERAGYVRNLIEKEESSLVECAVIPVVSAADVSELNRRCGGFEKAASWRQVRCASIYGAQERMLAGAGHRFLFELGSCAAFYPFESANMIESGNGIYLGTNTINGTPVIYDYTRRVNSNVTLVGESGRGKSTAAKTYVSNFLKFYLERYGAEHRVMLCIIDPHGEYAPLADDLGARVRDLEGRGRMGLDPFGVFSSASRAAGLLADAAEMPADLRSVTVAAAEGCGSVQDLVDRLEAGGGPHRRAGARAASYLLQFTKGDAARLFAGKSIMPDRTVYTMRKADKTSFNAMIVSMVMARAWRAMRDAPRHVPKLVVIDEGWFVSSMESTGQILEDIARSGRKENVHMLFLSQEPADILDNQHGQAVLNNSATIFLFGLKSDLARKLQGVLRLSDTERREIESLDRGHAILRADDHRIRLRVRPTAEQLEMFNTAPDGSTS